VNLAETYFLTEVLNNSISELVYRDEKTERHTHLKYLSILFSALALTCIFMSIAKGVFLMKKIRKKIAGIEWISNLWKTE
jgi:hypothetical protein